MSFSAKFSSHPKLVVLFFGPKLASSFVLVDDSPVGLWILMQRESWRRKSGFNSAKSRQNSRLRTTTTTTTCCWIPQALLMANRSKLNLDLDSNECKNPSSRQMANKELRIYSHFISSKLISFHPNSSCLL